MAEVIYHLNCLNGYFLKFRREVEFIMRNSDNSEDECAETAIKDVLISKDLTTSAYYLFDLRKKSPGS